MLCNQPPCCRRIGVNWSTPKNGSCPATAKGPGTRGPGQGVCTWKRQAAATVIWGQQLLDAGWNDTVVPHWPLHQFGPNTTLQYDHNVPVFDTAFATLDQWFTRRCCGC